MQKHRLVILIWNMGIGGIQKRVRDIVKEISSQYPDWEVFLLVKFRKPSNFVLPIENIPRVTILYFTDSHDDSKGIFSVFWVMHQYLRIRPQVVLTFLDHLSILMVIIRGIFFWIKTKLIINEGAVTSKYLQLNNRRFYWHWLVTVFYRFADQIIVPSRAVRHDLVNNFGVPDSRCVVVPNWTLFSPCESKKPIYDLIYVGRFEEEKNAMGFVSIIKELSKVNASIRVVMLGEGSLREEILHMLKKAHLQNQVSLPGFSYDPKTYYQKSKILVLPTNNEGMPNVVIEAGMCQLPTVSSNFVGAEEIILDKKTGHICTSDDMMVNCILDLLSDEKSRKAMGLAAQDYMKKHHSLLTQKTFIDTLLVY